jgi:ABC-2 type transport system permease protein/oleandomycin transport system permease protein
MSSAAIGRPSALSGVRWAALDSLTMARRNLMIWAKVPAFIAFTVIQPVMFTLLFRYVFGGAIRVPVPGGYVNYLLPGMIGQTAAFTSFGTAISLATEVRKGTIDRLRSMPIARSAVLLGRLGADLVRLLITVLIMVGVGYAVGFRFHGGVSGAIELLLLSLVLGLATAVSRPSSAWRSRTRSRSRRSG